MPHCSLDFRSLGLSMVTHAQWNEAQTQCALHLFADHRYAQTFLAELPAEEAPGFARFMMGVGRFTADSDLPADAGAEGMCRIEGVAALILTNFLVHLRTHVQEVVRAAEAPDLMGFWEPPGWRAPDAGIILWFDPDDGYHCVIARTRDQAAIVIRRLSWLERRRRESLCAKINRWNAPRQSPCAAQEIGGVYAQVLCLASAAAKIRDALQKQRTAFLN